MFPFLLITIITLVSCDNNKLPHEIQHTIKNGTEKITYVSNKSKVVLASEGGLVPTQRPLIDLLKNNSSVLLSLANEMGSKKKSSVPRKEAGFYVQETTTLPASIKQYNNVSNHPKITKNLSIPHENKALKENSTDLTKLNVTTHSTTNVKTHPTTNVTDHPTINVTAHPATNVTAHPATNVTAHPATNVTAHPTTNLTAHPTTYVKAHPTTNETAHPTTNVTAKPTANVTAFRITSVSNKTKLAKMKPLIVSYENLVNSYNNHTRADNIVKATSVPSNKKNDIYHTTSNNSEMIMPFVLTILVAPVLLVLSFMAFKRAREAWRNRHYKRMDFLLDGMYND